MSDCASFKCPVLVKSCHKHFGFISYFACFRSCLPLKTHTLMDCISRIKIQTYVHFKCLSSSCQYLQAQMNPWACGECFISLPWHLTLAWSVTPTSTQSIPLNMFTPCLSERCPIIFTAYFTLPDELTGSPLPMAPTTFSTSSFTASVSLQQY